MIITNCDSAVFTPGIGDVLFVEAQFINKNTLELVYKSREECDDLKRDYYVRITGKTKTYSVTNHVYTTNKPNRAYHYIVRWNVSPDLERGDTVTISTKYCGPNQYVDVPNY